MLDNKRVEQQKEAAAAYCKDAAFGTDRESMPELSQPFIEGARWADRNPFWKDGKTDYPKDDNDILVRCKITNGTSCVRINAIGKYQYEEGVGRYRLGKGVLVKPADCVYFYWMPMPKLPLFVNE